MKSLFVKHNSFLIILMLSASFSYSQSDTNGLFNHSAVKISEISTNSVHSDFGPAIVQDSLYFTTFNDSLADKTDDILKRKEFYDLYKVVVDKQGNPKSNRIPLKEFITRFNDGPVAWCAKTNELFVTQNYNDQADNLKPFQLLTNRLRINIFKRVNGGWKNDVNFPYNNPKYSVGHPAITESGDTLIFSSDKPGGYGETDLYYSIRKNGKWETPVNLGPKINTAQKEEFGFITDHNFGGSYLIFASKRQGGMGGFDLYYTRFPSDYSEIGHFESPINTEYDDFAITIPTDAEYGYLTSNRPGTGDDDIYKFTFKRFLKPQERFREIYVFDKTSMHPIPGAEITLCDTKSYRTDLTGKVASLPCHESECAVKAVAFGYPDKSITLSACNKNSLIVTRDTIWMNIIVNKKIALRNIYYDFDKWDILTDAAVELDQLVSLMKENPTMKVELSSHTDDRGTEPYNLRLSQLRARSAVDYIVLKGIDQSRIKGTGYGKTQLIHKGIGGKKCTPEENRENRRTEIFIPGFLRGEHVKQNKGDYSNGKPNAGKDYSSFKEHGSIIEDTPKTGNLPKIEKSPKAENAATLNIQDTGIIKFYLVLGSFQDESKALIFIEQLKSKGYKPTLCSDSAPFRVGIGYTRFREVKAELEILKDKYNGAWILTK